MDDTCNTHNTHDIYLYGLSCLVTNDFSAHFEFPDEGKEQEAHTTQVNEEYAFSSNIISKALSQMINEGTSS